MQNIYLLIFKDCTLLTYDRAEAILAIKEWQVKDMSYLLRVDVMFGVLDNTEYCANTVILWDSAKPTEYNPYI